MHAPDPLPSRPATVPVPPSLPPQIRRIDALDAARGFALLGILIVNTRFFFQPVGWSIGHQSMKFFSGLDLAAHAFVSTFFEGKFYPLFSLLFGMGMVAMMQSAAARGVVFWPAYLRRLVILGVIGLLHALLLWYGDILFIYAWSGLALLLLVPRCSPRTLAILGGACLGISIVFMTGLMALQALGSHAQEVYDTAPSSDPLAMPTSVATKPLPSDAAKLPAFQRLIAAWQAGAAAGPETPVYITCETEAFRDGPFLQAFFMRGATWGMMLIFMVFCAVPQIVAMFLFGAALMKSGFFTPTRAAWTKRAMFIGLGVGIPLAIGSTALNLASRTEGDWYAVLGAPLLFLAGPLMALGVVGAFTTWTRSGRAAVLARVLARTGRMALTNYLAMTVIATGLSYHWGFRLFGTLSPPMLIVVSLVIWGALVGVSNLWMARHTYGPMEWLWRWGTYLRRPA